MNLSVCARRVALTCLLVFIWPATVAKAASYYVHIPGIGGEQPVPGYPGAMNVKSLTIAPTRFEMVKAIDSASPALFAAVAQGTPLTATALAYNAGPAPAPAELIPFAGVLGSGYQTLPNGIDEEVTFSALNPGSLYLEMPGIVGEQSTPGHPAVMKLDEVTLSGSEITFARPIDAASAQLFLAAAQGTIFPEARLLFYDAANPAGAPDQVWDFQTLLVSSYAGTGGNPPGESVTLSFASIPEPSAACSLIIGAGLLARRRRA